MHAFAFSGLMYHHHASPKFPILFSEISDARTRGALQTSLSLASIIAQPYTQKPCLTLTPMSTNHTATPCLQKNCQVFDILSTLGDFTTMDAAYGIVLYTMTPPPHPHPGQPLQRQPLMHDLLRTCLWRRPQLRGSAQTQGPWHAGVPSPHPHTCPPPPLAPTDTAGPPARQVVVMMQGWAARGLLCCLPNRGVMDPCCAHLL